MFRPTVVREFGDNLDALVHTGYEKAKLRAEAPNEDRFLEIPRTDTFYGEDVSDEPLKNRESTAIRNFLERRTPYDVLAKSENGKSRLKRVFARLVKFLVE